LKIYVSRQHLWTVFTQRNFVADFVRLKLNFIKTKKSRFEPPFEGLRDNVRTLSIARWKARGRFFIRHNYFAISYGREVINENLSKSAFFEGLDQFDGRQRRPPTTVGVRKAE